MITGGDLRQSRLDVGYKTFTISPWRCSLYVLLTIFTPPDSQDFALLGSWL